MMKRRSVSCPVVKRTCLVLPTIVVSAAMLATMIVNMQAIFLLFKMKPAFDVHPQTNGIISFPHMIQGSNLVAERLTAYTGLFTEDGSNDEVFGIAALTLRNCGTEALTDVIVVLLQGKQCLQFRVQTILPGETVIVLEANRRNYEPIPCASCTASVVKGNSICNSADPLQILISTHGFVTIAQRIDTR